MATSPLEMRRDGEEFRIVQYPKLDLFKHRAERRKIKKSSHKYTCSNISELVKLQMELPHP